MYTFLSFLEVQELECDANPFSNTKLNAFEVKVFI